MCLYLTKETKTTTKVLKLITSTLLSVKRTQHKSLIFFFTNNPGNLPNETLPN